MPSLHPRSVLCLVCLVLSNTLFPAVASESSFPFGSELMLDAAPMRGSKRVPMLQIDENGVASIDLWCASVRAEAKVGDDTITIVSGPSGPAGPAAPAAPGTAAQCAPERESRDADLLTALSLVTNWRRHGDIIELLGATTLRFRLMTN